MALKVMIHGASGHIGQILLDRISHTDDFELAAAVAHHAEEDILSSLSDYQGPADVLIDFSNHAATRDIMEYCTFRRIPAVIATTGQTEEELALKANQWELRSGGASGRTAQQFINYLVGSAEG